MRLLTLLPTLALVAGCATPAESIRAAADAQARMAQVRTIEAECSGPCKISYTDPRDRAQMRLPTNGWDAAVAVTGSVERIVSGAVMPAAVAAIAIQGIKGAGHDSTTTTSSSTTDRHDSMVDDHTVSTTTDSHNVDSHDATATPTVVTQPPPLVVTQPAPIIVGAP